MSANGLHARLRSSLASRETKRIKRSLSPSRHPQLVDATLADFSSNDYLSLAASPVLKHKLVAALAALPSPLGPSSSRLLDGNTPAHLALETHLAAFLCADAALLFNSGFDANSGLWACLPDRSDYIVYDALIHASTHDGMRASRVPAANRRAFAHNSLDDLERVLRECAEDDDVRSGNRSVWVAVETLYSMDGDLSPLSAIVAVVERVLARGNGHMVVDEAHSTGLYGDRGRGIVCALGLANRITIRVHTFGKAMACSGAIVLCNPLIRSYLINYARPLIYSTAMPLMNVVAVKVAFEMLEEGHGDVAAAHLHSLSLLLLSSISALPAHSPISLPRLVRPTTTLHPPTTPIIPLLTSSPRLLAAHLVQRGFLVRPITYPTVPLGEERVRICLHAGNTTQQVVELAEAVNEWGKSESVREGDEIARPKL